MTKTSTPDTFLSMRQLSLFIFILWKALSTLPCQAAAVKSIAITLDDLPGHHSKTSSVQQTLAEITSTLVSENVPATGFVIGRIADTSEASQAALQNWARSKLVLANHTWSHRKYSDLSAEEFLTEVKRTETLIGPYRTKFGPWPKAFRFPTLDQGNTPEKETAANKYFAQSQTLLAHVSVDTSDWAFAEYYDSLVAQNPTAAAALTRLYLEHILDCVDYAESAADAVIGKSAPQILLLHANALNAVMLKEVIQAIRKRGYAFVSLEEALNSAPYRDYRYRIAEQSADHFFYQLSKVLKRPLPAGRDRTSYRYFQDYWEPRIKQLK